MFEKLIYVNSRVFLLLSEDFSGTKCLLPNWIYPVCKEQKYVIAIQIARSTRTEIAVRVAFTRTSNENGSSSRPIRTYLFCLATEPRNTNKEKRPALKFTQIKLVIDQRKGHVSSWLLYYFISEPHWNSCVACDSQGAVFLNP